MANGLLAAGDVEHIQLALDNGKPVDTFARVGFIFSAEESRIISRAGETRSNLIKSS
jgi:hypothetical protein